MSAFKRGTLAATLAAAMVVVPAFAGESGTDVVPKPVTGSSATQTKPDLIDQAVQYSRANPVVAIGIAKGKKDDMTGERMGAILSAYLKQKHDVPSKVFIEPGGDYTAVIFVVKGLIYGEYGLDTVQGGMAMAADSYNEVLRPRRSRGMQTAFAGKPEPQQ